MSEKEVQFVDELGRAPAAHMPGQPAVRGEDGRPVPALRFAEAPGVHCVLLHPRAAMPALGTATAAGYDLVTPESVTLAPGERRTIPLGLCMAFPGHLHGRIESRSGLALKGMVVLTGVIDADYRGEVMVIMQNFSTQAYEFAAGDRVAQLVLRPTIHMPFRRVDSLSETARGSGGFGSTGS